MEKKSKYEVGDIVYVSEYEYKDGSSGKNHLFVIIDVEKNEVVNLEYFGFIVSSQVQKSRENSNFKYNVPFKNMDNTGLNKESIAKCDVVYSFPHDAVSYKIGVVDIADYMEFMNAYEELLG